MHISKALPLGLTVGALALAAGGCGGTSPTGAGTGTGTPASSQNPANAAYAYSRCMRAHGVSGFPDPVVKTHGGSTSISQMAPSGLVSSPAFKSAQKACGHLQNAAQGSGPQSSGPGKPVLLAFARCLREHGISRFPDPAASGRLNLQTISADGVDVHSPAFFTAGRACVGVTHGQITVAQVAQLVNGSGH